MSSVHVFWTRFDLPFQRPSCQHACFYLPEDGLFHLSCRLVKGLATQSTSLSSSSRSFWGQLAQWERTRQVVVRGGALKCTSQTHTKSLSNRTDQGQGKMILHQASFGGYWKSVGKMPCLCEISSPFHRRLNQGFINMMNYSVCFMRQSVLVGVTAGKGTDLFTWAPNSVHVCEAHFATLTKQLFFHSSE